MREIRQSGSEGGARFNPLSLPLSALPALSSQLANNLDYCSEESSSSLRFSADLCASAFRLAWLRLRLGRRTFNPHDDVSHTQRVQRAHEQHEKISFWHVERCA